MLIGILTAIVSACQSARGIKLCVCVCEHLTFTLHHQNGMPNANEIGTENQRFIGWDSFENGRLFVKSKYEMWWRICDGNPYFELAHASPFELREMQNSNFRMKLCIRNKFSNSTQIHHRQVVWKSNLLNIYKRCSSPMHSHRAQANKRTNYAISVANEEIDFEFTVFDSSYLCFICRQRGTIVFRMEK